MLFVPNLADEADLVRVLQMAKPLAGGLLSTCHPRCANG